MCMLVCVCVCVERDVFCGSVGVCVFVLFENSNLGEEEREKMFGNGKIFFSAARKIKMAELYTYLSGRKLINLEFGKTEIKMKNIARLSIYC